MNLTSRRLVALAAKAELYDAGAIALPTVIEVAARKLLMSPSTLIEEALHNEPLRSYLAECARKAAEELH